MYNGLEYFLHTICSGWNYFLQTIILGWIFLFSASKLQGQFEIEDSAAANGLILSFGGLFKNCCIEIYVYFSQIDTYFGLPTQLISNIWFCCSDSQITLDYAAQFLIGYRLRGDNEINESLRSTWRDRQWYGYNNQRILLNIVKNSSKLLW